MQEDVGARCQPGAGLDECTAIRYIDNLRVVSRFQLDTPSHGSSPIG